MADFPGNPIPMNPIITPFSMESIGRSMGGNPTLGGTSSSTWPVAEVAYFYPFCITEHSIIYQLLIYIGATSSGNLDVGVYDSQLNRVVSAGSTAMSATTNTVQELNVTNTAVAPGNYLLAAAVDNITGTVFGRNINSDELQLPFTPVYQQAGLTAAALPNPCVPVITTETLIPLLAIGIQLRSSPF